MSTQKASIWCTACEFSTTKNWVRCVVRAPLANLMIALFTAKSGTNCSLPFSDCPPVARLVHLEFAKCLLGDLPGAACRESSTSCSPCVFRPAASPYVFESVSRVHPSFLGSWSLRDRGHRGVCDDRRGWAQVFSNLRTSLSSLQHTLYLTARLFTCFFEPEDPMSLQQPESVIFEGKTVLLWRREQLESLGREQLRRRALDMREAVGPDRLKPLPMHPEAAIEWIIEVQALLIENSDPAAPPPGSTPVASSQDASSAFDEARAGREAAKAKNRGGNPFAT